MKLIFENWKKFLNENLYEQEKNPEDVQQSIPIEGVTVSIEDAMSEVESYLKVASSSPHMINWFRDGIPIPIKHVAATKRTFLRHGKQTAVTNPTYPVPIMVASSNGEAIPTRN